MDVLGHLLIGVVVTGPDTSWQTLLWSLAPDVGAIPLQWKRSWENPLPWQLGWYRLCHSPLMVFLASFLPDPAFLLMTTHILADMVSHDRPYSDFPVFQWDYRDWRYHILLTTLGVIACLRLFC